MSVSSRSLIAASDPRSRCGGTRAPPPLIEAARESRNPVTMRSRMALRKRAHGRSRTSRGWKACWDEAWRSPGVFGTLVMLTAQHWPRKRFVPTVLESCAYQCVPSSPMSQRLAPAAEHAHRVSRRRRAAEPARRGRDAAPHAQRGQPADSRAGGATRLCAVRAAGTARRAQSRRAGAVAQRAGRAGAARRRRPGRGRRRGRRGAAAARHGAAVVREPLAAAADRPLARAASVAAARNRRVRFARSTCSAKAFMRPCGRARGLGRARIGAAVRTAARHPRRLADGRAPAAGRAARGARARAAARRRATCGTTGSPPRACARTSAPSPCSTMRA